MGIVSEVYSSFLTENFKGKASTLCIRYSYDQITSQTIFTNTTRKLDNLRVCKIINVPKTSILYAPFTVFHTEPSHEIGFLPLFLPDDFGTEEQN